MRLQSSDKQPWYREPWPWILMAGPFVVVVAGIITAWLAIRSNDGLVAEDYYKQGLAINQQLEREQAAGNLGLRGEVMRAGSQVRVMLSSVGGQVQFPERLTLRVAHPTRSGMDQVVTLEMEGPGMYSGRLDTEVSGRRHVVLEDPSGKWRLHGEWQADGEDSFRLVAGDAPSPAGQGGAVR